MIAPSFLTLGRTALLVLIAIIVGSGAGITAFAAAEADLLVAYDKSYADSVGGQDNANVLAANAVAGSNGVNERSGTGARARIVGYYQAAQALYQATSKGGFVNWMASYDTHMRDVVDIGNARGADLVAFLCVTTNDGAAAVAQQPGRYSCFDPGQFWTAVVAHELGGHNYGCDHRGGRENPKTVMMHNYCGGGAAPPYLFSNPNVWLNGVKLLGEGSSCLGAAVDGGDNAYLISTTAQGRADAYGRIVTAPNLSNVVRRWSFNRPAANAPAGTTVADSVSGTAMATVQGAGATFTGGGLRIPGGASGSGAAYLQLPAGVVSGYTNATIEIWAKTLSAQNWARLMDFNNGSSNYIMLAAPKGTDLNAQRFESKVGGAIVALDSGLPTATGVLHHYAITFAANGSVGGRWTWYRDGDEVAYLDVAYTLSALQDVNNWLGRSAYSADAFANCEYAEVRISNVAMTRDEVAANVRLGANRLSANTNLTTDDPIGQTSFNAAGRWSDGLAPSAGKSYETFGFRLRTPADTTSRSFAGQSLKLSGGGLTWKGTASSTITVNDLTLSGSDCEVLNAGSGTWTLGGNLKVDSDEAMMRAANGPINLTANLSGDGSILCVNNTVTLSGTNTAFTGKTLVGDGRFSGISIDSEARLGANPAAFTADQLTLNRGILYNSGNITIDDANRGIRIDVSAGIFNVAPGTTVTIAVPISSPAAGNTLQTAPLDSNPIAGLFIKENTGTLVLTHPNNSHNGEIVISAGGFTVSGAGRLNNGNHKLPITNKGTFTYSSTADQTLSGVISGTGPLIKSSTSTLTLSGANTFTGNVTINGGTLYANAGNAANNRALSYVSGVTVNSGATLRTSANALFGWDGTQDRPITVNAGGTLAADGGANGDVGVGTVTLAGGTITSLAASPAYGSWRFDDAADRLVVTDNSTVSALNVKFGNASAAVDVAAGKTLNFTGTITDATSGGVSYLTKAGTGTLTLAGANTYTGATAVNAGTLKINGSLGAGSTVTVASGATLSGTGTVGGALNFTDGSVHAPGDAVGRQTVDGALSYAAGARVKWNLLTNSDSAGAAGQVSAGTVNVTAGATIDLALNGAGSTANYFDAFWTQPRSWAVVSSSNMTGTFTLGTISDDSGGRAAANYGAFTLLQGATGAVLQWTPKSFVTWRGTKFGANAGNAAMSDFLANPDGDALPNGLEYFYNTDPNMGSMMPLEVTIKNGHATVTFARNPQAADVLVKIQGAESLAGSWTDLAQSTAGAAFAPLVNEVSVNESGSGATRTVELTDQYSTTDPAHPHRFFRLWIQQQ